ncbi:MAG TPA: hypothetical protein VF791_15095 [Pyrinomonadaceae bacterium]
MSEAENYFKSADEIEAVVRGFEECTLPDAEFSHPAHLIVALSYLHVSGLTTSSAAERMRAGLYRFLDHYGIDRRKYNETITLFWIKLVRGFLDRTEASRPFCDIANEMIRAYGTSRLVFSYYSTEHLMSEEARVGWVEPDLKPLDF